MGITFGQQHIQCIAIVIPTCHMNRCITTISKQAGIVIGGRQQRVDLGIAMVLNCQEKLIGWHYRGQNISNLAIEEEIEHLFYGLAAVT